MLKWYGYLGLALIIFAQINFFLVIQPFATWYIPIVWWGFILFVDSLVYKVKKKSLLSTYPKELLFLALLSIPFWSIFEIYNYFTLSWTYSNYLWYVHLIDFTTIMPAVIETFTLFNVLEIGKRFDVKRKPENNKSKNRFYTIIIKLLVIAGAFIMILPILVPSIGFPLMWFGILLFLDPLNYLTNKPSLFQKISAGKKRIIVQVALSGLTMGFFWECWNFFAYPKWTYNLPYFLSKIKLFEMPLPGYLGYISFMAEVYLFFAFFRSFIFKNSNELLYI